MISVPRDHFTHAENEFFLADSGYQGLPHAIVPHRRASAMSRRRFYRLNHSIVRSRIERLFGWWAEYRGLYQTSHSMKWVRAAASIVLLFEYHTREALYETRPCKWDFGTVAPCGCAFAPHKTSAESSERRKAAVEHRDVILRHIGDYPEALRSEPIQVCGKDSIAKQLDYRIRILDAAFADESDDGLCGSDEQGTESE